MGEREREWSERGLDDRDTGVREGGVKEWDGRGWSESVGEREREKFE